MLAAIELYKAAFGPESLPDTFGMDPDEAVALLMGAVRSGKALTPERLATLGYPPTPKGIVI